MKKTDNILLGFVLKSVFLSIAFVVFLTAVFSKIVITFDLDNSYCSYFLNFVELTGLYDKDRLYFTE